jgi:hypothetical protein
MRKSFIETREFTEWAKEYLTDEGLFDLQRLLLDHPETGAVIPGCGGLRKMRVPDPWRGKGKRGGARVIYLHVAKVDIVYLQRRLRSQSLQRRGDYWCPRYSGQELRMASPELARVRPGRWPNTRWILPAREDVPDFIVSLK